MAVAAMGTVALFLCSHAMGQAIVWSPDHKLYAVETPGRQVGKGQERERLIIFTEQGKEIAVAHVWLVEPDGTYRAGIRGCESWGWIDPARVFCQGMINPNDGVYLVFDAKSGRELREMMGTGFVWSPDRSRIADVGDARELGAVSDNSNSVEVDGKPVFPSEKDSDLHWFRSELAWSPDSRYIAVVDLRHKQGSLYLVLVGLTGITFENKLDWQENGGDWPPDLDYSVRWAGNQIIVAHRGRTQTVMMAH
ncbi:MAG TPA: hypothetical protein VEN79_16710 [Terriglobia bacterium]|nr:hypothetical protein [Terriglobia bacterium]